MPSFTLTIAVSTPSGTVSQRLSATAEAVIEADVAIAAASDQQVDVAFPSATLKAVYLLADQNMTLETNATSGAGVGDTIALSANVPVAWVENGGGSNPFSDGVSVLYVTAATAGTLKIRALYDPTA